MAKVEKAEVMAKVSMAMSTAKTSVTHVICVSRDISTFHELRTSEFCLAV